MAKQFRQGKRRNMVKFVINELSSVDMPAQEGAEAVLLKRKGSKEYEHSDGKRGSCFEDDDAPVVLLTSATDGHTHAVWVRMGQNGGETSYSRGPEDENGHDHPWVMDASGNIVIGEADGHTHTVDSTPLVQAILARNLTKENDAMTPEEIAALNDSVTDLSKRLELATLYGGFTDAQREHFGKLDESGKGDFAKLDADARQAAVDSAVEKAEGDNPVIFTAGDGTEFHKNDDPRLVSLAKQADKDRKELAKARAQVEQDSFEKRAGDEIGSLPGDVKVRAALLKAIAGITDDAVRKGALEAVVAGDKAIGAALGTVGHRDSTVRKDAGNQEAAEAELDKLAKARATEKGEDYYESYAKVAEENPELNARAIGAATEGDPGAN